MIMGTQNTAAVFAKYLIEMSARSRKQDAMCLQRDGKEESDVDVTVREAFLFRVAGYSKHFPSIKKGNKTFWRCRLHTSCLLTHFLQVKIQAIVQNCLKSGIKILQATFFHQRSTRLLARKPER